MRKFLMFVLSVLFVFSMVGCTSDINNVKLKSEREILSYAAKHFGKAKIVDVEKNDETKSVIYELQDRELGFYYTMKSRAIEVEIDATKTGLFMEGSTNNFKENYQNYIMEQLDIENIRCTNDISRSGQPMLFSISCETEKAAKLDISPVLDEIKKIDRRGYFDEYCIGVYDEDEYYLGSYAINSGEFTNRYEEYAGQMTILFALETKKNGGNLDDITYLYYEQLQYKDVEGLKLEWITRKNVTSDDWTTVYYFDYNGETYFMLDDRVRIDNELGMVHDYFDENYTNYWFVGK